MLQSFLFLNLALQPWSLGIQHYTDLDTLLHFCYRHQSTRCVALFRGTVQDIADDRSRALHLPQEVCCALCKLCYQLQTGAILGTLVHEWHTKVHFRGSWGGRAPEAWRQLMKGWAHSHTTLGCLCQYQHILCMLCEHEQWALAATGRPSEVVSNWKYVQQILYPVQVHVARWVRWISVLRPSCLHSWLQTVLSMYMDILSLSSAVTCTWLWLLLMATAKACNRWFPRWFTDDPLFLVCICTERRCLLLPL